MNSNGFCTLFEAAYGTHNSIPKGDVLQMLWPLVRALDGYSSKNPFSDASRALNTLEAFLLDQAIVSKRTPKNG